MQPVAGADRLEEIPVPAQRRARRKLQRALRLQSVCQRQAEQPVRDDAAEMRGPCKIFIHVDGRMIAGEIGIGADHLLCYDDFRRDAFITELHIVIVAFVRFLCWSHAWCPLGRGLMARTALTEPGLAGMSSTISPSGRTIQLVPLSR
jgi:hypothetical protein